MNQDSTAYFYPARSQILSGLRRKAWCDLLVIGGGLHGASLAHLSAFNGLRTVLLEARDYASGSSGRPVGFVHDSLPFDLSGPSLSALFRGIREEARIRSNAPHLTSPLETVFDSNAGSALARLRQKVGLRIYQGMRWPQRKLFGFHCGGGQLGAGLVLKYPRYILEKILAARQEGAVCLNYAEVEAVSRLRSGKFLVHLSDQAAKDKGRLELEAGAVVKCCGTWLNQAKFGAAAGADIPFDYWQEYCFFVRHAGPGHAVLFGSSPVADDGRLRISTLFPWAGGTVLHVVRRLPAAQAQEPGPAALPELSQDVAPYLPAAALQPAALCSQWSRRSLFPGGRPYSALMVKDGDGLLSITGGSAAGASSCAARVLKTVLSLAGKARRIVPVASRLLPGAADLRQRIDKFRSAAGTAGVSEALIRRAVGRYGGRVEFFSARPEYLEPIDNQVLRGELIMAREIEQAETEEDIVERRLQMGWNDTEECQPPLLKVSVSGKGF